MSVATWGTGAEIPGGPSWWADINDNAVMSGIGTLTVLANGRFPDAAPFTGEGVLSVAARAIHAAELTGSGQLTAQAAVIVPASAALAGSGALSAVPIQRYSDVAALTSSGTLVASVKQRFSAAAGLTGAGDLVALVLQSYTDAATLTGTGALSVAAYAIEPDAVILTGSGVLAVGAAAKVPVIATFSGSGALSVGAAQGAFAAVNLQSIGALTLGAIQQFQDAAALSGSGSLTSSAIQQFTDTAALTGSGALSATAVGTVTAPVAFDAVGAGVTGSAANQSLSFTPGSSANCVVVVVGCFMSSSTTVSATYAGTAMTLIGSNTANTDAGQALSVFALLVTPSSSSGTAAVTFGTPGNLLGTIVNCLSYENVSGFGTAVTNKGKSSTASSGTVSAGANDMVLNAIVSHPPTTQAISSYSGGTQRYLKNSVAKGTSGETCLVIGDVASTSASFTASTGSSNANWGSVAIPLQS